MKKVNPSGYLNILLRLAPEVPPFLKILKYLIYVFCHSPFNCLSDKVRVVKMLKRLNLLFAEKELKNKKRETHSVREELSDCSM